MAKTVKEKKTRGRRINAFDVMIILLVVCLVAALGYRIYTGVSDPGVGSTSNYVIEFECEDVYNSLADYIEKDEQVYVAKNGLLLGSVYIDKKGGAPLELITEAEEVDETETGSEAEVEQGKVYEKVDAKGKLKLNSDAVISELGNHFTVGDLGVTVGSKIEVYTTDAVFTLKVTAIYAIK